MCGISGYFLLNKSLEHSSDSIFQMMQMQKHRGPDDNGAVSINTADQQIKVLTTNRIHTDLRADLLLGFNRLSIMDISPNGHQPMLSSDGKVVLLLNGEIYNALDFKDDMRSRGYVFRGHSDTEVVLYMYQVYGIEKMLTLLNGMFAICIYDSNVNKMYLARDRFGIKPLYIYHNNEVFAFSSEIKSFRALKYFKADINPDFIDEFLIFRNQINDTLFKNIMNLEPGCFYCVDNNKIEKHLFYDINNEGVEYAPQTDKKEYLFYLLETAVKRQVLSDVTIGCQLSGGIDSSLVYYFASQKGTNKNMSSVSIVFNNDRYSEEKYIDYVNKELALSGHKYMLDEGDYFENFLQSSWHFEKPLNHPNTVAIYQLSREAKKHMTVLLSGEGADEIFAGYDRFYLQPNFSFLSKNFLSGLKHNSTHLYSFLKLISSVEDRMIVSSIYTNLNVAANLYPALSVDNALSKRRDILKNLQGDFCQKQRKYEMKTYLPDLLMRQDKMSMAHAVENRVPFLDNDLVSYALSLKSEDVIRKMNQQVVTKALLKEISTDIFGYDFSHRPKVGFSIPLKSFFLSTNFQVFWNEYASKKIKDRGVFNSKYIEQLVANIPNCNGFELDALWMMLSFEIWAQKYFDAS